MREKLTLVEENGLKTFKFTDTRNRDLSKKVAEILAMGLLNGITDAEIIANIWADENLSNEEVASLIYALPTAITKFKDLTSKLGAGGKLKIKDTVKQ